MAELDLEIVAKTAALARLQLNAQEQQKMSVELGEIFTFFDAINKADISDFPPLAHPLGEKQRLRPDIAVNCDMQTNINANATDFKEHLFTVPKVIE